VIPYASLLDPIFSYLKNKGGISPYGVYTLEGSSTHRRKEYGGRGISQLIIIVNQYYIKLSVIYGISRQKIHVFVKLF
jgi:hypothetical protein